MGKEAKLVDLPEDTFLVEQWELAINARSVTIGGEVYAHMGDLALSVDEQAQKYQERWPTSRNVPATLRGLSMLLRKIARDHLLADAKISG